jgi:hypothetical protein
MSDLKVVPMGQQQPAAPAGTAPPDKETMRKAIAYLTALGQGAEKAAADAARLGYAYVVAHYKAGTDPYADERAAAKSQIHTTEDDKAVPAGTPEAATGAPAAATGAQVNYSQALLDWADRIRDRVERLEAKVTPALYSAAAAFPELSDRLLAVEQKLAQHLSEKPGSPTAADLDAVEAEKQKAAATAQEHSAT